MKWQDTSINVGAYVGFLNWAIGVKELREQFTKETGILIPRCGVRAWQVQEDSRHGYKWLHICRICGKPAGCNICQPQGGPGLCPRCLGF